MKEKEEFYQQTPKNSLESYTDQGLIKMDESVISSIIKKTALSIDGVYRLAEAGTIDNLIEVIKTKNRPVGAIKIANTDDNITIDIKVIAEFGYNIKTLALNIQKKIMAELKNIAGIHVLAINVCIRNIFDTTQKVVEKPKELESDISSD